MSPHPHRMQGRASALSGTTNHILVDRLRAIRESGGSAMNALDEYDPNFSLKLAAASDATAGEALLTEWLDHRTEVLKRTQANLRDAWARAQPTGVEHLEN